VADFPNSKHKCLCPADFTGQHCEKEMGEIIMPFKFKAVVRFDTIQDDNFNMRLKADMSW